MRRLGRATKGFAEKIKVSTTLECVHVVYWSRLAPVEDPVV
jgi:hypothetical protein